MKLSTALQEQAKYVETSLGETIICERCGASLRTYSFMCSADLSDPCPGFMKIEAARKAYVERKGEL